MCGRLAFLLRLLLLLLLQLQQQQQRLLFNLLRCRAWCRWTNRWWRQIRQAPAGCRGKGWRGGDGCRRSQLRGLLCW